MADTELTNYRSGVSAIFGVGDGSDKGTAYAEEYFYHDKPTCDRKVTYIKSDTAIALSFNSQHVAYVNYVSYPGTFNSGSFVDGEIIDQAVTGGTAVILGNQSATSGIQIQITSPSGLNNTNQWTGRTSGAKFTPNNGSTARTYGTLGSTDTYGIIRYRIDREWQWLYDFAGAGVNNLPAYTAPFTFDTLAPFEVGVPVVGTVGSNGVTLTKATAATHYWRGITGEDGNEYHTMQLGTDNSLNPIVSTDSEFKASDGKVLIFVVNPKTPCLTIRATGNGQFHTTALKQYWVPRVVNQETYFAAGSGSVTFELRDINGNDVFYRINGGSWVNVPSSTPVGTPTLTHANFNDGINTLEYYYAGNQAYTKTRVVVKNPDYPSKADGVNYHERGFVPSYSSWTDAMSRINNGASIAGVWFSTVNSNSQESLNGRRSRQVSFGQGKRSASSFGGLNITGGQLAAGWTGIPPSCVQNYLWFVRAFAFENSTNIDIVGAEKNQGVNAIPSREIIYRGYYDTPSYMDFIFMCSYIFGHLRSDQIAGGFTAIEISKLREDLARFISEQIMIAQLGFPVWYVGGVGMWDSARNGVAMAACYLMPSYSSRCYGTCGLDGNTTTYPMCPFRDDQYTWKQVLIDNNLTLGSFPNYSARVGIEEFDCGSDGTFGDRQPYFSNNLMGRTLCFAVNVAKLYNPTQRWPNFDAVALNLVLTKASGHKSTGAADNYRTGWIWPMTYNKRFPNCAISGYDDGLASTSPTETVRLRMNDNPTCGFLWVEERPSLSNGPLNGPI
jgi:hypothetical protein